MGNCFINKMGDVIVHKEPGFSIGAAVNLKPIEAQSWDIDGKYLYYYDVELEDITENTRIFNPIFDTKSLEVLAPYLETWPGHIRLFFNVDALSSSVKCLSYEVD